GVPLRACPGRRIPDARVDGRTPARYHPRPMTTLPSHATPPAGLVSIRDPGERPHAKADWRERLALLRAEVRRMERVIVAYSGGVDSSVLLGVAHQELGARALGVIGVSDSYAAHELELARAQAARLGARIETVPTGELSDESFASNPVDRCYHC